MVVLTTERNNNINRIDAVNFAVNLHNMITNTDLPANYILRNLEDDNYQVIIEFTNSRNNHTGHVVMFLPGFPHTNEQTDGFVEMLCSIDRFNGYFMEIIVDTFEEMLSVIIFCQHLLQFQPNQEQLNYIRVPPHLLNYWCVQPHLRALNENSQDNRADPIAGI